MSDSNGEKVNSSAIDINSQASNENGEISVSDKKPSLASVTHKLKAEALRRFQLEGEIFDKESPSSSQDANVESSKLKEQKQTKSSCVDGSSSTALKDNQESASLSASDAFSGVNTEYSVVPNVEQEINVTNSIQASKVKENNNITLNQSEDSNAKRIQDESIKTSASFHGQDEESSDQDIVLLNEKLDAVAPESSVVNDMFTVEDTCEPVTESINDTVSAGITTEIQNPSKKVIPFLSNSEDGDRTQSINGNEINKDSEEIDSQSQNSVLPGQNNINIAQTLNKTSESMKIVQPLDQDFGHPSAELFDKSSTYVNINDHRVPENTALSRKSSGNHESNTRGVAVNNESEADSKSSGINVTSYAQQNVQRNGNNNGLGNKIY